MPTSGDGELSSFKSELCPKFSTKRYVGKRDSIAIVKENRIVFEHDCTSRRRDG